MPEVDLVIGGHSHSFLYGSTLGAAGPVLNTSAATPAFDASVGPYPTLVASKVHTGKQVPVVTAFFASRWGKQLSRS